MINTQDLFLGFVKILHRTHRIADLLCAALPRVRSKRFEEMGHMGPLTHARLVNNSIEEFLKFLPVQPAAGATYTPVIDRAA